MEYLITALIIAQSTNTPTVSGTVLLVLPILMFVAIAARMWITWRKKRK